MTPNNQRQFIGGVKNLNEGMIKSRRDFWKCIRVIMQVTRRQIKSMGFRLNWVVLVVTQLLSIRR